MMALRERSDLLGCTASGDPNMSHLGGVEGLNKSYKNFYYCHKKMVPKKLYSVQHSISGLLGHGLDNLNTARLGFNHQTHSKD